MDKGLIQYAAVPWRMGGGGMEILLITSSNGRWIIPKGWPMDGKAPHEAAAQEAWEEAGVRGEAGLEAVGVFHTDKVGKDGRVKRLEVRVFPLEVTRVAERWPEAEARQRRWVSQDEAVAAVDEPELAALLKALPPGGGKGWDGGGGA